MLAVQPVLGFLIDEKDCYILEDLLLMAEILHHLGCMKPYK